MTDEVKAEDFDAAFAEAVKNVDAAEVTTTASTDAAAKATADAEAQATDDAAAKAADEAAAAAAAVPVKDDATAKAAEEAAAAAAKAAAADTEAAAAAALTPEARAAKEADDKAAADAAATKEVEKTAQRHAEEAARRVAKETGDKAAAAEVERLAAEARKIVVPVLSDEDKKLIDAYEKEWPEQAVAFKKLIEHREAALEARFAQALVDVVGKLYKDIEPIAATATNLESTSHRKTLLEAHPDFDVLVDKLEPWIKAQPAYLQEGYMRVYNDGTAQEVINFVGQFKTATGVKTQVLDSQPSDKDTKQAERAKAAADKAAALAPVSGQRTTPNPIGVDNNDFAGAFAEAAATYPATR